MKSFPVTADEDSSNRSHQGCEGVNDRSERLEFVGWLCRLGVKSQRFWKLDVGDGTCGNASGEFMQSRCMVRRFFLRDMWLV